MPRTAARIVEDLELDEEGRKRSCIYAVCAESEESAGPVWGTGDASRKRALRMLTDQCGCGAIYHYDEEAE